MNPNYPTLRTVPETTYYFTNNTAIADFEYVMENIYHTTDFQVYKKEKFAEIIPKEITIPIVTMEPGVKHITRHPCVIVSHFNTDDLEKIISGTYHCMFEELNEERYNRQKEGHENYEKYYKKLYEK